MLWHMNQLYKQRENTAIAQYIPQGPLFCGAWKDFLQRGMNELWGQDGVEFFTWEGPGEGGVYVGKWTLTEDYAPALNREREKGKFIFTLGYLAREFGGNKTPDTPHISGLHCRAWGRVTKWCQMNLGVTTFQKERDLKAGGRPSGRG